MWIHNGNVKQACRRRHLPWREFSPLFNSPARAEDHGIASSGEVASRLEERRMFASSGAQVTVRENAEVKTPPLPCIFKDRYLRSGHYKDAVLYQPKGHLSA